MFDGADDNETVPSRWPAVLVASAILWLFAVWASVAFAQSGMLSDCSQTVGTTAAAVSFPAAGKTGNSHPNIYLEICNAHDSNTLGVNFVGGTAAIGSTGTLTLNPGGCMWWNTAPIPAALSIVGSAASTTTACGFN